jgi:hypothetical protein
VIILHEEEISIWAIPPLSPQPPDFFNHNFPYIPPLFIIPIPEQHNNSNTGRHWCRSWIYSMEYDLFLVFWLFTTSLLRHVQVTSKFHNPNHAQTLSTAPLHVITWITYEPFVIPHKLYCLFFRDYWICEDKLVYSWIYEDPRRNRYQCGVYMGLVTSSRFANGISHGGHGPAGCSQDVFTRHWA